MTLDDCIPGEFVMEYVDGGYSEYRAMVWETCDAPEEHPHHCWCVRPAWIPKEEVSHDHKEAEG